jgi:hypothetical protein
VVAVDEETGTVTIDTGGGQLCTVELGEVSGGNPVAVLLGQYFGNVSAASLKDALDTLTICVEMVPNTTTWQEVDCGENPPNARVISVDENGLVTVEVEGQPAPITILVDADEAESFNDALAALSVIWGIDGDGTVHQTSDEIERLHEEGIGFGVIVKLYSLAQKAQEKCLAQTASQDLSQSEPSDTVDPCTIDLNYLVEKFHTEHIGLGQLYKLTELGKPELLGVGHVRKAVAEMTSGEETGETPAFTKSNGLGRGHGNPSMTPPGLAKKNQDTSTETTVQSPSPSDSHPGNGKGPSKDNPGKGKNKGKP